MTNGIIGPSTVSSFPSNSLPVRHPFQTKAFYAVGLHWLFHYGTYALGAGLCYKTSPDGINWSAETIVFTIGSHGGLYSVYFDGTYVHYAWGLKSSNRSIFYRRGTPQSDGSVIWSDEQTAVPSEVDIENGYPTISVDSNGYAFITYIRKIFSTQIETPRVTKNANNDGTWSTAPDFPFSLYTGLKYWTAAIVTLTSGKMYVCYWTAWSGNRSIRGNLWTGSGWNGEEILGTNLISLESRFSMSCILDDVLIAWTAYSTYDLNFCRRTYGIGWGPIIPIYDNSAAYVTPYIVAGSNDSLFCIWGASQTANPLVDRLVYKYSLDGGTTWSNYRILADETIDGLTHDREDACSSFEIDRGDGFIGFAYTTGQGPYNLRYVALKLERVSNLKSGFVVARRSSSNLKASMNVVLPTTRSLKSKFSVGYDYIRYLNRSEVLFEGKTGYVPAYFYRNRTFSGEFTIKCEAKIYSETDDGGGAYVCSFSDSAAPIASMFGYGANDLAVIEMRRNGALYEVILGAEDAGGSSETSAPLTINPDTTYYLQLNRSAIGMLNLEVFSDPEFSVLVGTLSLPSLHIGEYTVLYAVDGKGYTGAPSPFPDGKVKVSKMRVVLT